MSKVVKKAYRSIDKTTSPETDDTVLVIDTKAVSRLITSLNTHFSFAKMRSDELDNAGDHGGAAIVREDAAAFGELLSALNSSAKNVNVTGNLGDILKEYGTN